MKTHFVLQGVRPHIHADHARREMLQSLMGPAPCWPDGTPRWMPPPQERRQVKPSVATQGSE